MLFVIISLVFFKIINQSLHEFDAKHKCFSHQFHTVLMPQFEAEAKFQTTLIRLTLDRIILLSRVFSSFFPFVTVIFFCSQATNVFLFIERPEMATW